jgi:hypothetical protein
MNISDAVASKMDLGVMNSLVLQYLEKSVGEKKITKTLRKALDAKAVPDGCPNLFDVYKPYLAEDGKNNKRKAEEEEEEGKAHNTPAAKKQKKGNEAGASTSTSKPVMIKVRKVRL